MFKSLKDMTENERQELSTMNGNTILWLEEGCDIQNISEKLELEPCQVEHNIDEILYVIRKRLGLKRYIKTLFRK